MKNTMEAIDFLEAMLETLGGEKRESQSIMTSLSEKALDHKHIALIQAGTGTGKSLAYLAAAAKESLIEQKKVLISTATLALQRQIFHSDFPILEKTCQKIGLKPPRIALLKGWSNYICKWKMQVPEEVDALFSELDLNSTEYVSPKSKEIKNLRAWAEQTTTGDKDDYPHELSSATWSNVSLPAKLCIGDSCPFAQECFVKTAREQVQQAQIVVTNHALLGVHTLSEAKPLPEYDSIIVDEAHELPAQVRSQGILTLYPTQIRTTLYRLQKLSGALLDTLMRVLLRIEQQIAALPAGNLNEISDELRENLIILHDEILDLVRKTGTPGSDDSQKGAKRIVLSQVEEIIAILEEFIQSSPDKHALWTENQEKNNQASKAQNNISYETFIPDSILLAPLQVGGKISNNLWADKGVVLTSATIAVANNFNIFAGEIGLRAADRLADKGEEAICGLEENPKAVEESQSQIGILTRKWRAEILPPSFNYAQQGILYVASDLPIPGKQGIDKLAWERFADLAQSSGGGALGLFSSRKSMLAAAEFLKANTDLKILCQGEAALPQLIEQFKQKSSTCLLGTLSLWQGVDVPGLACRLVVIDRIPFPRPDDPIISARNRLIEAKGRSAFFEISYPQAALLLAQGVGRLIRGKTDRGVVAILDPRLSQKSYGVQLRKSLPPFWYSENLEVVKGALERLTDSQ